MNKQNRSIARRISFVAVGLASAMACLGLFAAAPAAAPPAGKGSPVFIGEDGKLGGPMTGYAWIAASPGTTVSTPSPCNMNGCFKDTKGQLCTRGTIPALTCTGQGTAQYSCNWQTNWGMVLGMSATSSGGPWQAGAPSSLSVAYQGGRARYQLNAHVAGDPESKIYCVDAYQSGQVVDASAFMSQCWSDSGDVLGSFQKVDKITLEVLPAESPVSFDFCVTAIAVNGTAASDRNGNAADASHVVIEDNGKLGGQISGYAWVAGGGGTVFTTPQPCNQYGCFRNKEARLCAQGSIAPLACTGQGTPRLSCNWQEDWGAMIGINANTANTAWGARAPSTVAIAFAGPPADYRLMAHVAGDPDAQIYCVDHYQPGRAVDAHMLKSKCWSDSGDALASYRVVDKIGLQIMSAETPVPIDVCISDIALR